MFIFCIKPKNMTYNGQQVPTISPDARLVGCKKKSAKSYSVQLKEFFKSQDFQDFCNLKKNGIQDGSVLWIVRSEWPLLPLEGVNGEILFDFEVITADVPYLYKSSSFISRPTEGEKQIFFSQSYIVRQNSQGRWSAELILKTEEWLQRDAVKTAFEAFAATQGYRLIGNIGVYGIKFRTIDTQAWVSVAMSSKGEGRLLVCLLDSGRIVDLSTTEAELHRTPVNTVVKTKFNWFKYMDESRLIRN